MLALYFQIKLGLIIWSQLSDLAKAIAESITNAISDAFAESIADTFADTIADHVPSINITHVHAGQSPNCLGHFLEHILNHRSFVHWLWGYDHVHSTFNDIQDHIIGNALKWKDVHVPALVVLKPYTSKETNSHYITYLHTRTTAGQCMGEIDLSLNICG